MITKKDIQKLLKLSRINLDEKELKRLSEDLKSILEYVQKLNSLDIKNVPPTFYPLELKNVMREDEVKEPNFELTQELLEMAPEKEKGFFKTKKVL